MHDSSVSSQHGGAPTRYQVVLVNPGRSGAAGRLVATVRALVRDMGLEPDDDFRFLDETDYLHQLDPAAPVVAAYFGGASQTKAATDALRALQWRFVTVLPVVESTDDYTSQVPDELHAVNAASIDPADPEMSEVANLLLAEVGLLRARRAAFISYRRAEARGVAIQLFHALAGRNFHVFLDTVRVERGRDFQEALWHELLDGDVLVFLHTRTVFASRWVELEYARAAQVGLGILNVVWPGVTVGGEASLGYPLHLTPEDFASGAAADDAGAELTETAAHRITTVIEGLRARAFADRRRRVTDTFRRRFDALVRSSGARSVRLVPRPPSELEITRNDDAILRLLPVVGHPDTRRAQQLDDACGLDGVEGVLLFDADGLAPSAAAHLRWLNRHLPTTIRTSSDVEEWLPALLRKDGR